MQSNKPHKCSSDTNITSCNPNKGDSTKQSPDLIFLVSILILSITILLDFILSYTTSSAGGLLHQFAHTSSELLITMSWSVVLGIFIVGLMSKMPRDFFAVLMGAGNSVSGLFRAVSAGVLLDLCCHGILLVAAKLYERGVSLAQVVTFLVASPWNSFSLTLVLIALIGWQWTLLFILCSMLVALLSGFIIHLLTQAGLIPENPNKIERDELGDSNVLSGFKTAISNIDFSKAGLFEIFSQGWKDGKMIIKWLLFGTIIAASLRTFVPPDVFAQWLGPNAAGLFITLVIATIVEICSEGSAPVASEIVTNAHAPGNGFTFLMAGVATDYTELLIIREFTGRWAIALLIPLITVPQILLIGWLMNMASS